MYACLSQAENSYPSDAERAQRAQSTRALAEQITELAGHLNAANYRFLMLIAEFDRREGWSDNATHSCGGETMDYGLAIDVLLYQARKAKNVSAETSGDAQKR
jgi:hypothetical protein